MPPTTHSKLGASGAYRWLACPGSVSLSAGIEDKTSEYALEGTAAHALGEECILQGIEPHELIGTEITVDDGTYGVSEGMADAVKVYVDFVNKLSAELKTNPSIEKGFHLDWIHEDLWGTNDASIGLPFDILYVADYKHGVGVVVEPENNTQLMYYALGAIGQGNPHNYLQVELVIVQPRASHPDGPIRRWRTSAKELQAWADDVLVPGIKATQAKKPLFVAGDHCRFCRALSICENVGSIAATTTGLSAKQVFDSEDVELPTVAGMNAEQRVGVYNFISVFESWIKAVKADTHEQMMAGEKFPGLKLVAGRANRKWASGAEKIVSKELGIDAFTSKMKTPPQVEKFLKDLGKDPKQFSEYVNTTRGTSVASESDKRPAAAIGAAAAFEKEK